MASDKTRVEYSELAAGFRISRIVTGLWQIADMERDGKVVDLEAAARAMGSYVDAGLTTFDMADHYGSAELIAGRFARMHPRKAQLFTKWVPAPGPLSREVIRDAVERSLERLQLDTIPLLQFHAWSFAHPSWLDALFWLEELRADGLIRHLGVTNFDAAHLCVAVRSGIELVTNQVSYSVLDRRAAGGLTQLCRETGVKLLAYGTLAGGFLSERWLEKPEPDWERLDTWSQMKYGRFIRSAGGWEPFQNLLATLDRIARRHGASLANVACRHVLDQPAVAGIIVGARLSQREHVEDNLRVFPLTLDQRDRDEIAAAQSALAPIPGDCGDEYRRPPYLTASGDLSHHFQSSPAPYTVRDMGRGRTVALSGTIWEDLAGFARAVRNGDRIWISGTTATHGDRLVGGNDPAAQTHFIIDKIDGSLRSLGATLEHVVRTRIIVKNLSDWEAVSRVHGDRFRHILPANTLVQGGLVGEEYLVEIEAEAHVT